MPSRLLMLRAQLCMPLSIVNKMRCEDVESTDIQSIKEILESEDVEIFDEFGNILVTSNGYYAIVPIRFALQSPTDESTIQLQEELKELTPELV